MTPSQLCGDCSAGGGVADPLFLTKEEEAELKTYLGRVKENVVTWIDQPKYHDRFKPTESLDHHYLYLRAPSKAVRPALLMSACEAVGGDPTTVIPAACAVEVFHTWSLVHDDILDRDDLRRGRPTVHAWARDHLLDLAPMSDADREHLAMCVAILVGDNLLAFSLALMNEPALREGRSPEVTTALVSEMATEVTNGLIDGEMRDVLFEKRPLSSMSVAECLDMLAQKTGRLLEFCMTAGCMLGLNSTDQNDTRIEAARRFARHCGLAFQLQDDLLGLTGDVKTLCKPVGADIRAGKRTPIVLFAYEEANGPQRRRMEDMLGATDLSDEEGLEFVELVRSLGALDRARRQAEEETREALSALETFAPSPARDRLHRLARYIITRKN